MRINNIINIINGRILKMKKDNKGFSLVELIIVIAIMAILVGIVGSQVLPYLNKSREAKDQQIVSSWVTAALSAYSSNAAECTQSGYTITINNTSGQTALGTVAGDDTASATDVTTLKNSFEELAGFNGTAPKFASKTYQNGGPVTIQIKQNGNPVVYIKTWQAATNGSVSTAELVAK